MNPSPSLYSPLDPLPCPFCPGEVYRDSDFNMRHDGENHGCPLGYCGFSIAKWNRRVPVAPPGAPAAGLREQIALIVTDYSTGGEDISRTIDLLLALSAPSQPADEKRIE
jgi:hypothetical protein